MIALASPLRRLHTLGHSLLIACVLSACSSVPDAVNPVEWYKGASDMITGTEKPEAIATPRAPQGEFPNVNGAPSSDQKGPSNGLLADHSPRQYAGAVHRDVTSAKPLVRKDTPAETQTAAAPAAPASQAPAPQVIASAPAAPVPAAGRAAAPAFVGSTLSPDAKQIAAVTSPNAATQVAMADTSQPPTTAGSRQPSARGDLGPAAPPSTRPDMTPPAKPDIPATVPASTTSKPRTAARPVEAAYQQHLGETASTVSNIPPSAAYYNDADAASAASGRVTLHPPTGGRGKGFAAPLPPAPDASFQVAALDFSRGSSVLTPSDRANIAEIARLYRQTGGVIRVVGLSAGDDGQYGMNASMERANAVAHELTAHGVPAHKVFVGAAPDSHDSDGAGAKVYLDF